MKKDKIGGISTPVCKTYFVATVTKSMWYWQRDRPIHQCIKTEKSETDSCKYAQIIFEKVQRQLSGAKKVFQQMVLKQLEVHRQKQPKKSLDQSLTPYRIVNSIWDHRHKHKM